VVPWCWQRGGPIPVASDRVSLVCLLLWTFLAALLRKPRHRGDPRRSMKMIDAHVQAYATSTSGFARSQALPMSNPCRWVAPAVEPLRENVMAAPCAVVPEDARRMGTVVDHALFGVGTAVDEAAYTTPVASFGATSVECPSCVTVRSLSGKSLAASSMSQPPSMAGMHSLEKVRTRREAPRRGASPGRNEHCHDYGLVEAGGGTAA
jgi:hypothetical protein